VEDQSGGGQAAVTREELTAAWDRGAVRFAVRGPGARPEGEATLPTGYTIADFHLLPEAEREEAWRRYTVIRPLLAWPAHTRTRRAIEAYLSSLSSSSDAGRAAGRGGGASSRGSVERYLRAFEASGGDIRALVPATEWGGVGESRLDAEVEGIVQGVLAECRVAPAQRTVRDVYFMVVERVRVRNQGRVPEERLAPPGLSTIERRVRAGGGAGVLRRRPGPGERRAAAGVRPGPRAVRPLERVELDHTVLDLIVVDEEDCLPIGRPVIDRFIWVSGTSGEDWSALSIATCCAYLSLHYKIW
jgi:putative transposase